ncbi:hypothetical protein IG631_15588 [Alternaria alternata]|jgi:hypothetical protein|nr:hypothetical protein IG631_15588 [Alternaria alternata]
MIVSGFSSHAGLVLHSVTTPATWCLMLLGYYLGIFLADFAMPSPHNVRKNVPGRVISSQYPTCHSATH